MQPNAITWSGKIPLLEVEAEGELYFLPIEGKLFKNQQAYFFAQEFVVGNGKLYCSWGGRQSIEVMFNRKGVKFQQPGAFKGYIGVGFAYNKSGTSGRNWMIPSVIYFRSNPIAGTKNPNDWIHIKAGTKGFEALDPAQPEDFLPSPSKTFLQRVRAIARTYPDFTEVLPFPRREDLAELYGIDEKHTTSASIKPAMLPYAD